MNKNKIKISLLLIFKILKHSKNIFNELENLNTIFSNSAKISASILVASFDEILDIKDEDELKLANELSEIIDKICKKKVSIRELFNKLRDIENW